MSTPTPSEPPFGLEASIPPPEITMLSDTPPTAELPAEGEAIDTATVPGYKVLGLLGRGAMGVVYKARQIKLNRIVALKMILAGGHAGEDDLIRFHTEAESIARLQHPNIVQIHEVGEHGGLPYFSLEFCPGGSLDQKLNGTPLPPMEAAAVVEQLARGMEAAHRKGVVHRDLKPANVLLAEDGTPKITDFGLAKKLDETGQTQMGVIMGTPSYMAPEQAGGRSKESTEASDTYALGAILYECLTGRPPFKAATPLDTILQVVSDEPAPPRQLNPLVPADVQTICLKCLRKEPARRYATAKDLADDLRRFQRREPITARPVGWLERGWRWCRRNTIVASLVATAGALGILVIVATSVGYWQTAQALIEVDQARETAQTARAKESAERELATRQRDAARRNLYLAHIHLAQQAWETHDIRRLAELLEGQVPQEGEADFRGWEWYYLRDQTRGLLSLRGSKALVTSIAWSPDGTRLASAGEHASQSGELRVWDLGTGRELFTLDADLPYPVHTVSWSPDGKRLAWGGGRSGGFRNTIPGEIHIWNLQRGEKILDFRGQMGPVHSVAWSPDGRRLATVGGAFGPPGQAKVWDTVSAKELLSLEGHKRQVNMVSWSLDGLKLATASTDGTIKIWEGKSGKEVRTLRGHRLAVYSALWSPDGRRLASTSADQTAKIWDASTGQEVLTLPAARDVSLSWHPDGGHVSLNYPDGTVKIWQLTPQKELETLHSHVLTISASAWSPDTQRLALASRDQTILIWDKRPIPEALVLHGEAKPVNSVAWSRDGKRLATIGTGVKIWDTVSGRLMHNMPGPAGGAVFSVSWSPDGRRLVWAGTKRIDATLQVCDTSTGQDLHTWNGHLVPALTVAWSPDGRRIASGSADRTIKLWDAASWQEIRKLNGHAGRVYSVTWGPDGRWLASASQDGTVRLWDVAGGREPVVLGGPAGTLRSVAWSPDGHLLASGGVDLKIWETTTGAELRTLRGHSAPVMGVAWGSDPVTDRQRLASVSADGTLKLWDLVTGQEVLTLRSEKGPFSSVAWSPEGQRLVAGAIDGSIKVWTASR